MKHTEFYRNIREADWMFYTRKDLTELTGLDFRRIRELERKGAFPRRLRSRAGRVRWRADDVHRWMDEMGYFQKILKTISGVRFEKNEDISTILRPPKGLVFNSRHGTFHNFEAFEVNDLLYFRRYVRIIQCPDYPHCYPCRKTRALA